MWAKAKHVNNTRTCLANFIIHMVSLEALDRRCTFPAVNA